MANDVITQLRAYLDYASGEAVEERLVVAARAGQMKRWYQKGPVLAVLTAVLVLAVGVPALLLTSDPGPPAVSELSDPLDVGVEWVWPDTGFPGGPDEIAAAFAQQALGWTDVETESDPDASPDGPVWTTIRHGGSPDLKVLSVPIGDGLRVLMQVGSAGITVSNDGGDGQLVRIPRVAESASAVLHIRYLDPNRVEVVAATASDLERGQIQVDSDSPIGGVVAVYFNADGEAVTSVGGHFGPFDAPVNPTETSESLTLLDSHVQALPGFPSDAKTTQLVDAGENGAPTLMASYTTGDGALIDVVVQRLDEAMPIEVIDPSGTARTSTGPDGELITFVDKNSHTIQLIAQDEDGLTVNLIIERINRINPDNPSSLMYITEDLLTEWAQALLDALKQQM